MGLKNSEHISEIIPQILHDEVVLDSLLSEMSIAVTEMFRDPDFYAAVRQKVIPLLRSYPLTKIWHAGCSTGEEVYSGGDGFEGIADRKISLEDIAALEAA